MENEAIKALVIEDSKTDSQTLSYLLTKRLGCQVEIAEDGLEGLDKLSRNQFDVVFLDLVMPLMDGTEVLQQIRACPETSDLPVVVISGCATETMVRDVVRMGISDYVVKPLNTPEVIKRLSEIVAKIRVNLLPADQMGEGVREDGQPVFLIADKDPNFRHFFMTTLAGSRSLRRLTGVRRPCRPSDTNRAL